MKAKSDAAYQRAQKKAKPTKPDDDDDPNPKEKKKAKPTKKGEPIEEIHVTESSSSSTKKSIKKDPVVHDTEIKTFTKSQWSTKTHGVLLDQASKRGFRLLKGQDSKKAVTKAVLLSYILEHDGLIQK